MPDDVVSTLKLDLLRCKGAEVLAEWDRLKAEGKGWPIIVGSDKDLARLVETIDSFACSTTPEALLLAADKTRFPEELREQQRAIFAELVEGMKKDLLLPDDQLGRRWLFVSGEGDVELSAKETRRLIQSEIDAGGDVPAGDWPTEYAPSPTLPLPIHKNDGYRDDVNILRVPVAAGPDVLAYLRWVVVNEVPETRVHIAALRRWQEIYGAELVSLTESSITLRVSRRPQTQDEAIALAQEHLLYCQPGTVTAAPLAFDLMHSDWWFFWWD